MISEEGDFSSYPDSVVIVEKAWQVIGQHTCCRFASTSLIKKNKTKKEGERREEMVMVSSVLIQYFVQKVEVEIKSGLKILIERHIFFNNEDVLL